MNSFASKRLEVPIPHDSGLWSPERRLGKEEGWAVELKEMEKLKEGELLFFQCAPLLTIIASFLNGNESGNHSGTNKSGLGSSWGKRLVLLIL